MTLRSLGLGFLTAVLFVPTAAPRAWAQQDPDLVLPSKDDGVEQDAIAKEKMDRADVSDDDAQDRKIPQSERTYTRIVPEVDAAPAPKLKEKLKNGTKQYETSTHTPKYSAGFRIGPYDPTSLVGTTPGVTYQEIYGNSPAMMADFTAEYDFFKSAGKLGAKVDFGFITAKGQGVFVHNYNPGIGSQANESITFVGLPLVAALTYQLQFWKKQVVIPYAEAGAGYFTLFELRSDLPTLSENLKYGGAPIGQAAGGLKIMLDGLDKEVLWELEQEYGISHISLTLDAKQIFQLGGIFNFSSLVFEGGFLFEF